MEREKYQQSFTILMLFVCVIFMTVGFAAYSTNLTICGSATVKNASWNVAFDTAKYTESENSVAATEHSVTADTASFTIALTEPGDFYEAEYLVENTGTFNAKLASVAFTKKPTADQSKYLTFTVTVDGTIYDTDTTGLNVALAKTTGTHVVKTRVNYVQPDSATELPTEQQVVELSVTLGYTQQ